MQSQNSANEQSGYHSLIVHEATTDDNSVVYLAPA